MTILDQTLAPTPRPTEPLIWATALGAGALVAVAAVAAAPLAAYVWLIALFGIPHVVSELRYCDERFSGRSARRALAIILSLLAVLCAVRLAGTYGAIGGFLAGRLELLAGASLALAAALFMRRRRLLGCAAAGLVTYGALNHPIETFLIWAWIHNLTPMAFVAEALEGRARTQALLALAVPFLLLPAFVALGGAETPAWTLFGHDAAGAVSAFGAGRKPLGAFLPSSWPMDDALPLFQAAVVAQVMHYIAVIVLMPRLLSRGGRQAGPMLRWPSWPVFYALLAVAGLASLLVYAVDFGEARSAYALAAALHSWIELPVFLMALGGGFTLALRRPAGAADRSAGPTASTPRSQGATSPAP